MIWDPDGSFSRRDVGVCNGDSADPDLGTVGIDPGVGELDLGPIGAARRSLPRVVTRRPSRSEIAFEATSKPEASRCARTCAWPAHGIARRDGREESKRCVRTAAAKARVWRRAARAGSLALRPVGRKPERRL
jgi:hypothetical protein